MRKLIWILPILLIFVIILLFALDFFALLSFLNEPLNKLVSGDPDLSCIADDDCTFKRISCHANCPNAAVNRDWSRFCPFNEWSKIIISDITYCPPNFSLCVMGTCRAASAKDDFVLTLSAKSIEIRQNGAEDVGVSVYNGYNYPIDYKLIATPSDENIMCLFKTPSGLNSETEQRTLIFGHESKLALIVQEKGGVLRTASCIIEIIGAPKGTNVLNSVIIKIEE